MTKQECLKLLEALHDDAEVTLIIGKCNLWQLQEYAPNTWNPQPWQMPNPDYPFNPYRITCDTKTWIPYEDKTS